MHIAIKSGTMTDEFKQQFHLSDADAGEYSKIGESWLRLDEPVSPIGVLRLILGSKKLLASFRKFYPEIADLHGRTQINKYLSFEVELTSPIQRPYARNIALALSLGDQYEQLRLQFIRTLFPSMYSINRGLQNKLAISNQLKTRGHSSRRTRRTVAVTTTTVKDVKPEGLELKKEIINHEMSFAELLKHAQRDIPDYNRHQNDRVTNYYYYCLLVTVDHYLRHVTGNPIESRSGLEGLLLICPANDMIRLRATYLSEFHRLFVQPGMFPNAYLRTIAAEADVVITPNTTTVKALTAKDRLLPIANNERFGAVLEKLKDKSKTADLLNWILQNLPIVGGVNLRNQRVTKQALDESNSAALAHPNVADRDELEASFLMNLLLRTFAEQAEHDDVEYKALTSTVLTQELQAENAELRRQLRDKNKSIDALEARNDDLNKQLAPLEWQKLRIAELETQLDVALTPVVDLDEPETEEEQKLTPEEISEQTERLQNMRVVVVGGAPNWQTKLKTVLPDATYYTPDDVGRTLEPVQNADVVIVNTATNSHKQTRRVSDAMGKRKPIMMDSKGTNTDRIMEYVASEMIKRK